jgi:ribosomal protein S18 acetylase RimI-like enzyme
MIRESGDAELTYGPLPQGLWPDAIRLLAEERVSIAGVAEEPVWRAFLEDSRATAHPLIVSACDAHTIHGVVLCLIDPARYWRRLLVRHPLVAVQILAVRLKRRLRWRRAGPSAPRPDPGILNLMVPNVTGKRWADSSPEIAKIMFIGVDRRSRKKSIGRRLYQVLFRQLRLRGVRRVDACIDWPNVPSIHLHRSAGWELYARPQSIMASYDLSQIRDQDRDGG